MPCWERGSGFSSRPGAFGLELTIGRRKTGSCACIRYSDAKDRFVSGGVTPGHGVSFVLLTVCVKSPTVTSRERFQ